MRFELEPAQDLGLQHVLQNGLLLVRGGSLEAHRRTQVIEGLLQIVSDADKGAEALQAQSLTFALDERPAFERFSLFFRYLDGANVDLPAKLANAKAVLAGMEDGQAVPPESLNSLEEMLLALLGAIERERALAPLISPRELNYN